MLVAAIAMLIALALVELRLPLLAAFLDADLAIHYFGAGGILLPVLGLVLLVGAAGGLYPGFLSCRASSPRGAQGQQVLGRAAAAPGRLRNVARRRPVRGLDRPDHLHLGDLRADRLCAELSIPASTATADPGRAGGWRFEVARQLGLCRARIRRACPDVTGVARTNHRRRHDQQVDHWRWPLPGAPEDLNIGIYRVDPDFSRHDGDAPARRAPLRRALRQRPRDHGPSSGRRRAAAGAGRWPRAGSTSSSTSARPAARLRDPAQARRHGRSGSASTARRTGPVDHRRRRRGHALPHRRATRSSR